MIQLSIIGNLTKDAEQKQIGEKYFNAFTVAVNEGKDAQGNERTTFIQVLSRIYGDTNNLIQYLMKGTKVYVQGRPSFKTWQKQDGTTVMDVGLFSDKLELLSRSEQGDGMQQAVAQMQAAQDKGDLPF